jgi:hypothetical protein
MPQPRHKKSTYYYSAVTVIIAVIAVSTLFRLPSHARTASEPVLNASAAGPVLQVQSNTNRAIAFESVTMTTEPFAPTVAIRFGSDNRTRVMLFATNVTLLPGDDASAFTAEAQDETLQRYPLIVEYVGPVDAFPWLTEIVVRLNDNLGDVGDVLVGITFHGAASNRVRIGIGHIGGGPPDDSPGPIPDLGPGASLHGKQVFPPDNAWN